MNIQQLLTSRPVAHWRTRQAVIFDWHDGPREGVCALAEPACEFHFALLDERHNADDLNDRLFGVSALTAGSVDRLLTTLRVLGEPVGPVWVPVWRFADTTDQIRADAAVEAIRASGTPTDLAISTQDMERFLGCWRLPATANGVGDWFRRVESPLPAAR